MNYLLHESHVSSNCQYWLTPSRSVTTTIYSMFVNYEFGEALWFDSLLRNAVKRRYELGVPVIGVQATNTNTH